MKLAKAAGKGSYPSKKVAKTASKIGLGVGSVLWFASIYGMTQSAVVGIGSLAVGVFTLISNSRKGRLGGLVFILGFKIIALATFCFNLICYKI